jgi:DNA-binding NarL/FixJ family response regulator
MPVRILVADDHQVVRTGLRTLLESKAGWEVCGEATHGRDAVQKATELKPDVAVLDIAMPILNGVEATRQIRKLSPATAILILSMHDSELLVQEVLEAGARGYILIAAVEALSRQKTYLSPRVAEAFAKGGSPGTASSALERPSRSRLTPREREVVQLLAEGKSNKEVAQCLGISVKTAETHRANIMLKLNFHSVTELVRYAVRNKIIQG